MSPSPTPPDRAFATTRWSLVVAAQQKAATADAAAALADLCRLYWYPLYAYIRRRGYQAGEAEDLAQGFFARLLEKDGLAAVTAARGRFRSFLLTACQNFLANERERANALKRGGGRVVSLDLGDADSRYRREPAHEETPERLYERRWALVLLGRVMQRLRAGYEAEGKGRLFDAIRGQLTGESEARHAELALALGSTAGAVKTAVHRLRKRYGELLREEIAETVATEADVKAEILALFQTLSNR